MFNRVIETTPDYIENIPGSSHTLFSNGDVLVYTPQHQRLPNGPEVLLILANQQYFGGLVRAHIGYTPNDIAATIADPFHVQYEVASKQWMVLPATFFDLWRLNNSMLMANSPFAMRMAVETRLRELDADPIGAVFAAIKLIKENIKRVEKQKASGERIVIDFR